MISIQGVGHYFHRLAEGHVPPSLEDRLRAACRERFRRIDRFIELALLGSGECVAERALAPACGLYMGSGIGPIGTNVVVQDSVSVHAKAPMPFHFVNTLGSSAGYYVGRNLGMSGESFFVSRRGGSFTAALACAAAAIETGAVSQALVGAIEECLLPPSRFRSLAGLNDAAQTAEGSHWLLLTAGESGGTAIADESLDSGEFAGYESADAARITSFALRHPARRFGLLVPAGSTPQLVAL